MKKLALLCSSLLLPLLSSSSLADTPATHRIDPAKVLSVVTSDWNDDGGMDRAVLVEPSAPDEDDAGLYLYLSGESPNDLKLALFKPNFIWSGSLWGTLPSLALNKAKSLEIRSMNEGIGRHRWSRTLTVAYRNKAFVVAGYTYQAYDTLSPDSALQCDINLLTGKGIKNDQPVKIAPSVVTLADWSEQSAPAICQE